MSVCAALFGHLKWATHIICWFFFLFKDKRKRNDGTHSAIYMCFVYISLCILHKSRIHQCTNTSFLVQFMFQFHFITPRLDIYGKIIKCFEKFDAKQITMGMGMRTNGINIHERSWDIEQRQESKQNQCKGKGNGKSTYTDCWHATPGIETDEWEKEWESWISIIRSLRCFIAPQLSIKLNASINKYFVRYSFCACSAYFFYSFSSSLYTLPLSMRATERFGWCRGFVYLVVQHDVASLLLLVCLFLTTIRLMICSYQCCYPIPMWWNECVCVRTMESFREIAHRQK